MVSRPGQDAHRFSFREEAAYHMTAHCSSPANNQNAHDAISL